MKKYIISIKLSAILLLLLPACSEDLLDKDPLDRYSDPVVWSDINLASIYLNYIYNRIDYGNSTSHGYCTGIFAQETVLTKGGKTITYNTGAITADRLGRNRGHLCWRRFSEIQKINIFLDNIDQLSDSYPESDKASIKARADVLKGEALFLRAIFYSDMCRSYGGVPLLSNPSKLGDDFLSIARGTFKETIDFIVKDLDDAAQLLKLKSEMEMGRATKEAALAIKSRILLFAASDLTADGTAENELVGYISPDRTALWAAARDAAKAVIDLGTCELSDFGAPDQEAVAKNCFEFFKSYDLSDKEFIWGKMFVKDVGTILRTNLKIGPNGINNWGNNGVLQNMVDNYEMMDGSKFFDHFTVNNNDEYINTSTVFHNENPYHNREPRFYASVLYDSAVWQPRFSNLADIDPLGIYDRRTRIVIESGQVVSERFGLDTRKGPIEPWNGGYSGYLMKKYMDDKIVGKHEANENIFIYIRYAEVLLNYAEASIELGDIQTGTTYINKIRNRAGLPDFTGDITQALRHERKVEFFAEDNSWYDIRRWKILEETLLPTPYGIDIKEITEDGITTTTWKRIRAQPDNNPVKKMYWIPISTSELNRAPQLIQNPGY